MIQLYQQTFVERDREIRQRVLQELQWDSRMDATEVGVEVQGGVVMLTGAVESYAKKMAAEDAVHQVMGVCDVSNHLQVHVPLDLMRTDAQIAHAVRRALEWNVLVPHENLRVTVQDGWVILQGSVPFRAARNFAERVAGSRMGVHGISNQIEVHTHAVAQTEILQSIEEALERRGEPESGRIQVQVKDGTVSLTGRVHSWSEKQAILDTVNYAPGVVEIEDHLSIDPYF